MSPKAQPISPVLSTQPKQGKISGFDFYRDPLNADHPFQSPEEIMKKEMANKPAVMKAQQDLLERRYNLEPKLDPAAKMSRGKPLVVGPTARLAARNDVGQNSRHDARADQAAGPVSVSVAPAPVAHKRRPGVPENADRDVSAPGTFRRGLRSSRGIPAGVSPAIFLSNRPELGDVSRGEVVSINNFYRLFKDILTPVQLDGLRMLLTPFRRRSSIRQTIAKARRPASALPASTVT